MILKKPEILAPVGQIESFYAAVENGADAIYVGGKLFSARQFADNADKDQLKEIVEYARLRGIKVYVTVNTLIKNAELDKLVEYIQQLCQIGVDALIVQDFGVARIIKKYFPSIVLHASTQMSAHSKADVQFLKNCGYERVVVARELTLEEIKHIKKEIDIEIEAFVHGALCVCYSGQCLMSSLIGGRSGNRGRCAQPCRLPYILKKDGLDITNSQSPYLMSPKDMQALEILPELLDAGIDSFKIEGRMKAPEYVASVVRVYRKYMDLALLNLNTGEHLNKENKEIDQPSYKVDKLDKDELLTVFNRGGFTKGYFTQKPGNEMMMTISPKNSGLWIGKVVSYNRSGIVQIKASVDLNPGDGIEIWTQDKKHVGTGISKSIKKGDIFSVSLKGNITNGDEVYLSKNHSLLGELKQSYKQSSRKSKINVYLKVKMNKPIKLILEHESDAKVSVLGEIVSLAQTAPVTNEQLYKQISKFGNTPFNPTNIVVENDSNIYIQISKINELRRKAVTLLIEKILSSSVRDCVGYEKYTKENKELQKVAKKQILTANVRNLEQLKACASYIGNIYLELQNQTKESIDKALVLCKQNNSKLYISLPHIERDKDYPIYADLLKYIETTDVEGYIVRTYGQYEKLKNTNKKKIIDYTLNVMNNQSIMHWESLGADVVTLSLEMSGDEIEKMRGKCLEMIIYGHIPIMTTEQCLLGRYKECQKHRNPQNTKYELVDRKNESYPIAIDCNSCRMQLLSSKPIVLANKIKRIHNLPASQLRFLFTIETSDQIKDIISWYLNQAPIQDEINYTSGYFVKGVE